MRRTFNKCKRMHVKNKFVLLVLLTVSCTVLLITITRKPHVDDTERKLQLQKIDESIQNEASSLACNPPRLPVFSPEIIKFIKEKSPIDCYAAGPDWVKCKGSECRIQHTVVAKHGHVKCSFADVIRDTDYNFKIAHWISTESSYKLEKSDVVRVRCKAASGHSWSATLTGIRYDPLIWKNSAWGLVEETSPKINVLMFGLDSISRNSFIRKLPKTYDYLTNSLKADVLQGYNIIGDGTPQALIPILTGQTELELPDTRKRFKDTVYVDSYPFIWKDYKRSGYVTAFYEDVPESGTFTYRLNGFDKQPTDHYMRPYYLATAKERYRWPELCAGDTPRHKLMLDHIVDFFNVYGTKPKFLFGFHGELSHDDYNLVGVADDDLVDFLKELNRTGILDNTLLILMADHGHRFAEIRNTLQGKLEERLPFFSFKFPDRFKKQFSTAYRNFQTNLNKLTTPFDIHSTLLNVLKMEDHSEPADISKRAVSLFSVIPRERSCAHAHIEPHWCACMDWTDVPLTNPMVPRMALTFLNTLNQYTQQYRNICDTLSMDKIEWIKKVAPNQNLIRYKKNSDQDGFVPDMSAKMKFEVDTYQIKTSLKPGGGIFEATITHLIEEDLFLVKFSDISRVNMYRQAAKCVENLYPHLRKYCHCKT